LNAPSLIIVLPPPQIFVPQAIQFVLDGEPLHLQLGDASL
jgi:hypothetical protein